ncbi:hypothetical protein H5410_022565 [Solanum commersonii]|uniref:Uncharacterized protein n=1 Tax=Solanum commersonii TaxID=4109 RepID=A0A9J5ZI86_SOLCO|nr:hypothetical protein H5410_022565 [Solanum commersonii]
MRNLPSRRLKSPSIILVATHSWLRSIEGSAQFSSFSSRVHLIVFITIVPQLACVHLLIPNAAKL